MRWLLLCVAGLIAGCGGGTDGPNSVYQGTALQPISLVVVQNRNSLVPQVNRQVVLPVRCGCSEEDVPGTLTLTFDQLRAFDGGPIPVLIDVLSGTQYRLINEPQPPRSPPVGAGWRHRSVITVNQIGYLMEIWLACDGISWGLHVALGDYIRSAGSQASFTDTKAKPATYKHIYSIQIRYQGRVFYVPATIS